MSMSEYWAAALDYQRDRLAYERGNPHYGSSTIIRELSIDVAQRGLMTSAWHELEQLMAFEDGAVI